MATSFSVHYLPTPPGWGRRRVSTAGALTWNQTLLLGGGLLVGSPFQPSRPMFAWPLAFQLTAPLLSARLGRTFVFSCTYVLARGCFQALVRSPCVPMLSFFVNCASSVELLARLSSRVELKVWLLFAMATADVNKDRFEDLPEGSTERDLMAAGFNSVT